MVGIACATSPSSGAAAAFNKRHLQTFTTSNKNKHRGGNAKNSITESGDVLHVSSKQTNKRKNVGAFRRKRQDYATWKGRVGVHVEYDDFDLKKLMNVIYQTLSTDWEIVDCYDVMRLWLPVDSHHFSAGEEDVPPGEGAYAEGDGQIHASMPEVFVFGFGAVVFWNFKGEDTEKQWIEQHLTSNKEVLGLKHNPDAIESACDEMGFCYGDTFRWHRDVVQLQTRDAGEKLAVSFAVAKSANLSIYEWRMQSAVERNAYIPEDLAKHGSLSLSRREINVEVGRLYLLSYAINLETNMLDTPEEFWEDDKFEPNYKGSIKYLDVDSRIILLNTRLEVLKGLNSILMEAAHNHHASFLEWIIIILIVAEILIESFRAWRETHNDYM